MSSSIGPSVSVLVCAYTFERFDDVVRGVAAIGSQTRPPDEIVLVIDHNEELHKALDTVLADISPRVRIIDNDRMRGLSGARTTGIASCRHDVVAFLDDDAQPRPDWLASLIEPFSDPNIVGTGGRAVARWPKEQPQWFPSEFLWVVGCSYVGQPTERSEIRNPIGCNMAFRRDAMLAAGGFALSLGRIGKKPVGCEETELSIRLTQPEANGTRRRIEFVPDAVVDHRVSSDRVSPKYFFSRCWSEGRSKSVVAELQGADRALESERNYVRRTLPSGVRRGLSEGLRGSVWGPVRSFAIVSSLLTTTSGYVSGRFERIFRTQVT